MTGRRAATLLLTLVVCVQVLGPPLRALAQDGSSYTDPLTGQVYTDVPPLDLLDGKSRTEQSRILQQWQTLGADAKQAYRDYVRCKHELAAAEKKLADAEATRSARDAEYKASVLALKRLLLALLARLGLQTTVVVADAATDLYLAGRSAARALEESGATKPEKETDPAARAEMDEAIKRAAKTEEALRRLERDLANAELARDLAKAERDLAARRAPVVEPPRYANRDLEPGWKDTDKRRATFDPPLYRALTPQELANARLYLENGKVYVRDPRTGALRPFSTEGFPGMPSGRALYVMDEAGNLYAVAQARDLWHSSFFDGKPVAAAGEMVVKDGVPLWMNRNSGHYKPEPSNYAQALAELERSGVDTSRMKQNFQRFRDRMNQGFENPGALVFYDDLLHP